MSFGLTCMDVFMHLHYKRYVVRCVLDHLNNWFKLGVCDMTIVEQEQLKRLNNLPLQQDY